MKQILAATIFLLTTSVRAQDSNVFEKLTTAMKTFIVDTSAVPNDRLTQKVKELRQLRGGFNIAEAVAYKIAEERTKENANQQELDQLEAFFTTGNGKKWLDNAITHIYRAQFTEPEMDELIRFYKTSAGKKMADSFPLIMLQSSKAADEIQKAFKP